MSPIGPYWALSGPIGQQGGKPRVGVWVWVRVCVWVCGCVVGSSPRRVVVGLGRASVGQAGIGSNRVGSGLLRVEL